MFFLCLVPMLQTRGPTVCSFSLKLIDSLLILTSGPAVCAGPFFPIEASAMPPDDAGRKNRKAGHSKLERVTDHVLTRFVTRLAIVAGLPLVVWGLGPLLRLAR